MGKRKKQVVRYVGIDGHKEMAVSCTLMRRGRFPTATLWMSP